MASPVRRKKTTETATCKNTSIAVSGVCAKNLGDIIWGAQKSPPRPPRIFNLGEYTGEKPAREGPEANFNSGDPPVEKLKSYPHGILTKGPLGALQNLTAPGVPPAENGAS